MTRTIQLDHTEIIRATQQAMIAQLRRDGRLTPGMELGLTFSAPTYGDIYVTGTVRRDGQALHELTGRRPQLCAIATQVALDKLSRQEQRSYLPEARVHWRIVRFSDDTGVMDKFVVDVEFQERQVKAG